MTLEGRAKKQETRNKYQEIRAKYQETRTKTIRYKSILQENETNNITINLR